MTRRLLAAALLVALVAGARVGADGPKRIRIEHDDTEITESVIVEPGTYRVADTNGNGVLIVKKDGVTVDLNGATLEGSPPEAAPDTRTGVGISVVKAASTTIRNGAVRGFKVGVRLDTAHGTRVHALDASGNYAQRLKSTPLREDPSDWLWPHENDKGEWESHYGAGISLNRCNLAEVAGCTVRHGQNGLLLTGCSQCAVFDNDFSFNSGWGIALYRSNQCDIARNSCDFCVRGYSHTVYARGQDSAGILVFEQSSDNLFVRNSATHSGDGFFLYAGHETTQRTGTGGCNRNRVVRNYFSDAVANGIEATFSEANVFVLNDVSRSDYGVWAGYSRGTRIAHNLVHLCLTDGVAIEHGQENVIQSNEIGAGRYGVHLWWDDDKDLLASPFCRERDCSSSKNRVIGNRITAGREPVHLVRDEGSVVEDSGGDDPPPVEPSAPGTREPALTPEGREHIRIGEWGPLDPRESQVFPSHVDAAGNIAEFWVLGPKPGRIVSTSPGVLAALAGGKGPSLHVTNADPKAPSVLPFRVEVEVDGKRQTLTGTLFVASWDVRWFPWTKDPREDRKAYDALVAGEPKKRETVWALDFPWQTEGPHPEMKDRFATVATTTLRLPAGRYRVRTTSDDGIRVRIDDRLVIDNWTWHGPTENVAELELSAGDHSVRVDHFEIDGWAALRFSLELVTDHR